MGKEHFNLMRSIAQTVPGMPKPSFIKSHAPQFLAPQCTSLKTHAIQFRKKQSAHLFDQNVIQIDLCMKCICNTWKLVVSGNFGIDSNLTLPQHHQKDTQSNLNCFWEANASAISHKCVCEHKRKRPKINHVEPSLWMGWVGMGGAC